MALNHTVTGSVNYTIIGTPTILDGILTNIDANNRVKIENLNLGSNSFEIGSKVKFSQVSTSFGAYGFPATFLPFYIAGGTSIRFEFRANSTDAWNIITLPTSSITPQVDIWYWWKVKHDGNGNYTFSASTDNQNWISETAYFGSINVPTADFLIGRATSGNAGAIDLNETYIKVNGQAVFGVCPIEVKKVILNNSAVNNLVKDDKLIFVDEDVYALADGNSWIDTGIKGSQTISARVIARISESRKEVLFGARESANLNNFSILHDQTNIRIDYGEYDTRHWQVSGITLGNKFDIYASANYMSVIDLTTNTKSESAVTYSGTFETPQTLLIAGNGHGNYSGGSLLNATCKIYRVQIMNNCVVVRDFVPVPAGMVIGNTTIPSNGMFDIINQQFYANQGTGSFTIGKDE